MSNIFDGTELDKRVAEAEANFGEEIKNIKLEETPELFPDQDIEENLREDSETEEASPEIDQAEDDERPKDAQGWKKLREKNKTSKVEAETQRKLAEAKEKELLELRERLARLEGREEARSKPEIKETDIDPEPDSDLDPDLHMKWELRQTRKEIEIIRKRVAYAEAVAKNEGTRRGLEMLEKEYIKSNKLDDYNSAIEHIKTVNRNLIKLEYPQATDAQIESHLEAEKIKKAAESYGKGMNPAEYFYKMAQTLGYQKMQKKIDGKPNIEALNRNMGKNANLIGSSNVDNTGNIPTDKVVRMSINQLLSSEGSEALEAAIRREEAKLFGI